MMGLTYTLDVSFAERHEVSNIDLLKYKTLGGFNYFDRALTNRLSPAHNLSFRVESLSFRVKFPTVALSSLNLPKSCRAHPLLVRAAVRLCLCVRLSSISLFWFQQQFPLCSMIIRRFFQFHFSSFSTLSPLQKTHLFRCNKTIQDLSKLGRVAEARHMFDPMPHQDPGSWNTMISGYTQNGLLHEAQMLFNVFRGKNVRTWTILLTGYSKFGLVDDARMLFEAMPERNVV